MEDIEQLEGKRVVVLGLGVSGLAACKLCADQGAEVIGLDRKSEELLGAFVEPLRELDVELYFEKGTYNYPFDLLICSPGIPQTHPTVVRCLRLGTPIIGEVELASWFCKAPVIAVTGTDGKSTVVSMVHRLLTDQHRSTRLVGNIGYPFAQMVLEDPPEEDSIVVLEISSYQLETIRTFRPHVAAVLNIAPDHLQRHGDLDKYAQVKYRITMNQTEENYLIRPVALPGSFQSRAQTIFWSTQYHELPGICYDSIAGNLSVRFMDTSTEYPCASLREMMPHQLHNVLASLSICLPLGVDIPAALKTLIEFPGLPHRVEYLGRWSEVKYYNDSKATNVHACSAALTALEGPLILLAGGKPKAGEPYEDLLPLVKKKCREIILFGEARDILQQAWQSETLNMNSVETLEEATQLAIERAQPGDSILLSPACASFDRFQNFEQRGNFFKSLISDWVVEKTT